jgi:hypothetical protein
VAVKAGKTGKGFLAREGFVARKQLVQVGFLFRLDQSLFDLLDIFIL